MHASPSLHPPGQLPRLGINPPSTNSVADPPSACGATVPASAPPTQRPSWQTPLAHTAPLVQSDPGGFEPAAQVPAMHEPDVHAASLVHAAPVAPGALALGLFVPEPHAAATKETRSAVRAARIQVDDATRSSTVLRFLMALLQIIPRFLPPLASCAHVFATRQCRSVGARIAGQSQHSAKSCVPTFR
jgi:hypothetical protein